MAPLWDSIKHWLLSGFMPHGHCYLWQPGLITLQVVANGLIGLSYLAISLTLLHLVRRIRNLPFEWMWLAFGLFIVACGATHFMDILVIWAPVYWVDGALRLVTAIASASTAVLLFPLVSKAEMLARIMEDRRRAEALAQQEMEREELLRQAQQGVQTRDVFLSIAAHELKTPLTPLRMEVEGLLRGLRLGRERPPAVMVERLARVQNQITRLDRLVSNMLEVSRIAAGRLELKPEEVDLAQVVPLVVQQHGDELRGNGYAPPELQLQGPACGLWDRGRIEQIVTTLLSNAIKYGQGKPLLLSVGVSDGVVRLTVRDQGIGIAPEDQERIFERFERAASARHYGGLGLGLWIVRQALTAMGGTIRVQSGLSTGSSFIVELPRLSG